MGGLYVGRIGNDKCSVCGGGSSVGGPVEKDGPTKDSMSSLRPPKNFHFCNQ